MLSIWQDPYIVEQGYEPCIIMKIHLFTEYAWVKTEIMLNAFHACPTKAEYKS